jgi:hypothetical protein
MKVNIKEEFQDWLEKYQSLIGADLDELTKCIAYDAWEASLKKSSLINDLKDVYLEIGEINEKGEDEGKTMLSFLIEKLEK